LPTCFQRFLAGCAGAIIKKHSLQLGLRACHQPEKPGNASGLYLAFDVFLVPLDQQLAIDRRQPSVLSASRARTVTSASAPDLPPTGETQEMSKNECGFTLVWFLVNEIRGTRILCIAFFLPL
jgi:hypothetical protein